MVIRSETYAEASARTQATVTANSAAYYARAQAGWVSLRAALAAKGLREQEESWPTERYYRQP